MENPSFHTCNVLWTIWGLCEHGVITRGFVIRVGGLLLLLHVMASGDLGRNFMIVSITNEYHAMFATIW